jgi:hypothetical protein
MNELERALYKTRSILPHVCLELDLDPGYPNSLQECSSCSIWLRPTELQPDLDELPICRDCWTWYGE